MRHIYRKHATLNGLWYSGEIASIYVYLAHWFRRLCVRRLGNFVSKTSIFFHTVQAIRLSKSSRTTIFLISKANSIPILNIRHICWIPRITWHDFWTIGHRVLKISRGREVRLLTNTLPINTNKSRIWIIPRQVIEKWTIVRVDILEQKSIPKSNGQHIKISKATIQIQEPNRIQL